MITGTTVSIAPKTTRQPGAITRITVRLPGFIRGDITYLRQDFSVGLPAENIVPGRPNAAPVGPVRFDYVVRTRPLTAKERARAKLDAKDRPSYPQRDAALFALRELSGKDLGADTAAWQTGYPSAELNTWTDRLVTELNQVAPADRADVLSRYRDGKDPVNTTALLAALSRLEGDLREQTRNALVSRLAGFQAADLRPLLRDPNPDLSRAAIRACGSRKERSLVPDLIALLEGPNSDAARLARISLRTLTKQSFDRPADWTAWWLRAGAPR